MSLPNGDRAVVDIIKLREYCLSSTHPRGRHKARVFSAALGLSAGDASFLRQQILQAARLEKAVATRSDRYGQRYQMDFFLSAAGGSALIRTAWIVRRDEDFPRLTTCYVLE